MVYIFKDRLIRVEWTIYKGISPVKEDFSRSNVKVFLLGNREKYLLQARADKGTLYVDIPSGLEEGTYSIEAIWVKNMDHVFDTRSVCRSKKEDLFSITEFEDEATNIGEGVVVLKVKTSTATYGYDGLSSYELAVLRGDWNGTEGEWLKHERYVSVLDSRGDSEVDTMSQKAITDELEAQDNAIEDILEDTGKLGERVEEAEEKVNNMGDVVDEIKSHAPVSARPAGFKPDIDLTPEITVDRAWRDHEGNVIRDTYITRRGLRNEIIDITNQQVTDLKPGSVDPDDLSEATKQLIGNKSITNLPDEEDITVTDNQTLKLKDKEYAPKDYSGMGRVYLRKHYVNGVNTLTQHMMRKPNTIYIIQYDYCLAGQTIEVPENCVLDFQGGSLRNGTIIGASSIIESNSRCFIDIVFTGYFFSSFKLNWFIEGQVIDGVKLGDILKNIKINDVTNQSNNNSYGVFEFSYGKYLITSTIDLSLVSVSLIGNSSILTPSSDFTGNYIFDVFNASNFDNGYLGNLIKDFQFNCNNNKNVGAICLWWSFGQSLYNINCYEMGSTAIYIKEKCPETTMIDFRLYKNLKWVNDLDNIPAVKIDSPDGFYSNGYIAFYSIGMDAIGGSGSFKDIHIWGYPENYNGYIATTRIGIKAKGSNWTIRDIILDTITKIDESKNPNELIDGAINGGVGLFLENQYSSEINNIKVVNHSLQKQTTLYTVYIYSGFWNNIFTKIDRSKGGTFYFSENVSEEEKNYSSIFNCIGYNNNISRRLDVNESKGEFSNKVWGENIKDDYNYISSFSGYICDVKAGSIDFSYKRNSKTKITTIYAGDHWFSFAENGNVVSPNMTMGSNENPLNDIYIKKYLHIPVTIAEMDNIYVGHSIYDIDVKNVITYNGEKWVDGIGNAVGLQKKGITSERPIEGMIVGFCYIDTTLNKPIWWTGTNWVDATGATV